MKINYGPGAQQLGGSISQIGNAFMQVGLQKAQQNEETLKLKYEADSQMAKLKMGNYASDWMSDPTNLAPEGGNAMAVSEKFKKDFNEYFGSESTTLFNDPRHAEQFLESSMPFLSEKYSHDALSSAQAVYVEQTVTQATTAAEDMMKNPTEDIDTTKKNVYRQYQIIDAAAGLKDPEGAIKAADAAIDNSFVTRHVQGLLQGGMSENDIFSVIDKLAGSDHEEVIPGLSTPYDKVSASALKVSVGKSIDNQDKQTLANTEQFIISTFEQGAPISLKSIDDLINNTVERNRLPLVKLKVTASRNNDSLVKDSFAEALDTGGVVPIAKFNAIQDRETRSSLVQRSLVNLGMQAYSQTSKGDRAKGMEAIQNSEASMEDKYKAILTFNIRLAKDQEYSLDSVKDAIEASSDMQKMQANENAPLEPFTPVEADVPLPEMYNALEAKKGFAGQTPEEEELAALYVEYQDAPAEVTVTKEPEETVPKEAPAGSAESEEDAEIGASYGLSMGLKEDPLVVTREDLLEGVVRPKEVIAKEIEKKAEGVRKSWMDDPALVQAYEAKSLERLKEVLYSKRSEYKSPEELGKEAANEAIQGKNLIAPSDFAKERLEVIGTQKDMSRAIITNMEHGFFPTDEEYSKLGRAEREQVIDKVEKINSGEREWSDSTTKTDLEQTALDPSISDSMQKTMADSALRANLITKDDHKILKSKSVDQHENFTHLYNNIKDTVALVNDEENASEISRMVTEKANLALLANKDIIGDPVKFAQFQTEVRAMVYEASATEILKNSNKAEKMLGRPWLKQIGNASVPNLLQGVAKGDYTFALNVPAIRDMPNMFGKPIKEIKDSFAQAEFGKNYGELPFEWQEKVVDLNSTVYKSANVYQEALVNTYDLKTTPYFDASNKRWVYADPDNPGVFLYPSNLNSNESGGAQGLKWGMFYANKKDGVYDFANQSQHMHTGDYMDTSLHTQAMKDIAKRETIEQRGGKVEEKKKTFWDYFLMGVLGPERQVSLAVTELLDKDEEARINKDLIQYRKDMATFKNMRHDIWGMNQ